MEAQSTLRNHATARIHSRGFMDLNLLAHSSKLINLLHHATQSRGSVGGLNIFGTG